MHLAFPLLSISCVLYIAHLNECRWFPLTKKSTCSKNTVSWQQSIKLNATDSYSKSNYLYNWRYMKYQVRYLLVRRSRHPNHWAKLDKRGLGIRLDTWQWTWCLFQVDLCSTLSAILIWKLHNFEKLNIQSCCHFLPFDKKLACFTNYQERRSFPWPLVINNPRTVISTVQTPLVFAKTIEWQQVKLSRNFSFP